MKNLIKKILTESEEEFESSISEIMPRNIEGECIVTNNELFYPTNIKVMKKLGVPGVGGLHGEHSEWTSESKKIKSLYNKGILVRPENGDECWVVGTPIEWKSGSIVKPTDTIYHLVRKKDNGHFIIEKKGIGYIRKIG